MPNCPATDKDPAEILRSAGLNAAPQCEEYEKMISGMLYNCLDPALVAGRMRACRLWKTFNQRIHPESSTLEESEAKDRLSLAELLGKVGKDVMIQSPFFVDYGCNIIVGDRVYMNLNATILDVCLVTIGDRVMFGPNVSLYTATHETGVQSRRDYVEYGKPITIGSDCWLGGNVTVLPGVTIGKGSTIGAGSIVTGDIPEFSVAVGSPARVIGQVERLEDMTSQ